MPTEGSAVRAGQGSQGGGLSAPAAAAAGVAGAAAPSARASAKEQEESEKQSKRVSQDGVSLDKLAKKAQNLVSDSNDNEDVVAFAQAWLGNKLTNSKFGFYNDTVQTVFSFLACIMWWAAIMDPAWSGDTANSTEVAPPSARPSHALP